ncbi:MAG: EVE domain-containing protein [Leptospiraceae bacterium]|nr:EVE domain-containing protein [Leptospiraceae bacterium]MCP5496140.1 EVE domain-containing protein [Leptospiraceae bacterium]
MNYWLFKSEPNIFSIEHLKNSKNSTAHWEGVRNYQARNYLRDKVKQGDKVLFYHSNSDPKGIVGICKVVKEGYIDHFAFDKKSPFFDPISDVQNPRWYMVDIQLEKVFEKIIPLSEIKKYPELQNMVLVRKGSRLSIQPVTKEEFEFIVKLNGN